MGTRVLGAPTVRGALGRYRGHDSREKRLPPKRMCDRSVHRLWADERTRLGYPTKRTPPIQGFRGSKSNTFIDVEMGTAQAGAHTRHTGGELSTPSLMNKQLEKSTHTNKPIHYEVHTRTMWGPQDTHNVHHRWDGPVCPQHHRRPHVQDIMIHTRPRVPPRAAT
jgi:hypothetical protein